MSETQKAPPPGAGAPNGGLTSILLTLRGDIDPRTTTLVVRYDPDPMWWSVEVAAYDEQNRLVPTGEFGHGYRVKTGARDLERLTCTMVEILEPDGS